MSRKPFRPVLNPDGTLDPSCFVMAGLRWVEGWLAARLARNDPYFPVDTRADEDPEAFVAAILTDAGLEHPGSALIARAALRLLDKARAQAPREPHYFQALLGLCQRVPLPYAGSWFTEELERLARDPEGTERHWGGYEHTKEIVFAAMVQSPGLRTAASRPSWLALMKTPKYATLALLGLKGSAEERFSHLNVWWRHCPSEDRERELDQMMFTELKMSEGRNGSTTVQSILRSVGWAYPRDLKDAINHALKENGGEPAFNGAEANGAPSRRSKERAVHGAGRVDAKDAA
jgi:hypothetical protein